MKKNSGQLITEALDAERKRIIELLLNLNVIRRDALGDLVAVNTHGTEVVYVDGLERITE